MEHHVDFYNLFSYACLGLFEASSPSSCCAPCKHGNNVNTNANLWNLTQLGVEEFARGECEQARRDLFFSFGWEELITHVRLPAWPWSEIHICSVNLSPVLQSPHGVAYISPFPCLLHLIKIENRWASANHMCKDLTQAIPNSREAQVLTSSDASTSQAAYHNSMFTPSSWRSATYQSQGFSQPCEKQ